MGIDQLLGPLVVGIEQHDDLVVLRSKSAIPRTRSTSAANIGHSAWADMPVKVRRHAWAVMWREVLWRERVTGRVLSGAPERH